tara:strand:+ start:844 stop:3627 length:2784 start_codon:yes stop_codon:yes gene_type:complete
MPKIPSTPDDKIDHPIGLPPKHTSHTEVEMDDFIIKTTDTDVNLKKIPFQEHLNVDRLELLSKGNENVIRDKEELTRVLNLLSHATKGKKETHGRPIILYDYSGKWKAEEYGRVYSVKFLSIGTMRRDIRGFVIGDEYYDFDLKNAHPSYLYQVFVKNGYELPHLLIYNTHRPKILKTLMDTLKTEDGNIDRDRAKQLFLQITYGGHYTSWIKGRAKKDDEEPTKPIINFDDLPDETKTFIQAFQNEVSSIILPTIAEHNPTIIAKYKRLKARDPLASTASLFAQTGERYFLELLHEYAEEKKLNRELLMKDQRNARVSRKKVPSRDGVLCYDGIMLRKKHIHRYLEEEGKSIPDICREMGDYIKKHSGYDMVLEQKPIETSFTEEFLRENIKEEEDIRFYPDDIALCHGIREKYGHLIKASPLMPQDLYVYMEDTGQWVNNPDLVIEKVLIPNDGKDFPQSKSAEGIKYWGSSMKSLASAVSKYKHYAKDLKWFEEATQNNSLGKILLEDGYYDFDTATFHKGFTPDIIFHERCSIPYEMEWDDEEAGGTMKEVMEMLYNKLFDDPAFDTNKSLKAIPHYLARAIAGKTLTDRSFMMGTGATTSGKGTIATALKSVFGGYVAEINTTNLCPNKADDIEKSLGFLVDKRFKRILIAQEQPKDRPLSSDLIKKISGGDSFEARKLYSNAINFLLHGSLLLFNNSVEGAFDEVDEATRIRIRAWKYDKTFTREVVNPDTELPIDLDFKTNLNTNKYWKRAFLQIIIDAYHYPDEEAISHSKEITKTIADAMDVRQNLLTDYLTITRNHDDFITIDDLKDIYSKATCNEDFRFAFKSPNDIKKELVKMRAILTKLSKQTERKVGGRTEIVPRRKTILTGVKLKEEEEEDEEIPPLPDTESEDTYDETKNVRTTIVDDIGLEEAFETADME